MRGLNQDNLLHFLFVNISDKKMKYMKFMQIMRVFFLRIESLAFLSEYLIC